MTIRRIIGLVLLTAAIMFGAADLWHIVVPTYGAEPITMGRLWLMVSARSLSIAETLITRHLWSPIWEVAISPLLIAPAWIFFGLLGFAFFIFGRQPVSER